MVTGLLLLILPSSSLSLSLACILIPIRRNILLLLLKVLYRRITIVIYSKRIKLNCFSLNHSGSVFKRSITFISNQWDKHSLCILKIKWPSEQSLENILFFNFKYGSGTKIFLPEPENCVERDLEQMLVSEMEPILQEADPGVVWVRWPGPVIASFTTKWSSRPCSELASIKQKKQQPTHSATSWNIGGGPDTITIIGKRSHFKSLICRWQGDLKESIDGQLVFRNT